MLDFLSLLWNEALIRPMTNGLVLLYVAFFNNFGLSILLFTLLVRLATLPLTMRQIRSTQAMGQIQPKLQELQKRHAGDRQRISQETFRMYREAGVNPIGCLGPMVVQMPIWIALYWSLIKLLPANPENLVVLSQVLYSWLGVVHTSIPIDSNFLGMDLAMFPSQMAFPVNVLVPFLVGSSMWAQQKIMMTPNSDPRQRQSQQMMLWMFPIMFGFITFQFPSGLALYWIASNVIGVAIQSRISGWGGLRPQREPAQETLPAASEALEAPPAQEVEEHGISSSDGQNRRRSRRARPQTARNRARRGRGRGNQPR